MKKDDIEKLREALLYLADVLILEEEIKRMTSCDDCGKVWECPYRPELGGSVRYNCPLWRGKAE